MKTIEIKGSFRTELGKKNSKQVRKSGNVPCVIYGKEKNIHFLVHENSFKTLVYTTTAHLVKLSIEDKEYKAVLKEMQFHPVSDKILHADFIEIIENKPVTISIPIKISGDSVGILAGGKLVIKKRRLKVKGLADDLPEFLPINITKLKIHESFKVGDLSYPKIELLDSKRSMVLAIATSRVAQVEEEEVVEEQVETTPEAPAEE
ncbi:MAG TPA: 50S ribosomal protein L25/general stress protein Ctc [Bacteroidales bacterium]|nr:50S ribosomal protein L25/general stress protein Ctc [Bacteroidales bacterium]